MATLRLRGERGNYFDLKRKKREEIKPNYHNFSSLKDIFRITAENLSVVPKN